MTKPKRATTKQRSSKIFGWLDWWYNRKFDLWILGVLLIVTGLLGAANMTGYPQRFEDEGTYVSQAWAVKETQTLTHYTYWYDHPPAGWLQLAGYLTMSGAIERYDSAIIAGREFMLILHLASVALLFLLSRRLGLSRLASGFAALIYVLSPLVVEFSRYVLLDNVALPWLLAALYLALSPRRHLLTAVGSALCLSLAILSKETFAIFLPVIIFALWQTSDKRNRRYTLTAFTVVFFMTSSLYLLYAVLKNELLPGEGHVSLLGTLLWQVFGREGSGSLWEADSNSRGLLKYWLSVDHWLLLAGGLMLPLALWFKKIRVIGLALLVSALVLLRDGYLPFPFVIGLLPFAALAAAGGLDYLLATLRKSGRAVQRLSAGAALVVLLVGSVVFVAPGWQAKLRGQITNDHDAASRRAVAWIDQHLPRDSRLVVESALWTDLQYKGFNQPDPVWLYKTETDPAIAKSIGGWQGIDYIIINGPTIGAKDFAITFPTVHQAINQAQLVAEFGQDNQKILIYQVQHVNTDLATLGD